MALDTERIDDAVLAGSSELARPRTRQFAGRPPARDPGLHLIERNRQTGALEFVDAAAILRNVGAGDVDHRVEQSRATASASTAATS